MLKPFFIKLIAAFLFIFISGTVYADGETEKPETETTVATEETSGETKQTVAVVLTDPEIAAVEEEEPDCE